MPKATAVFDADDTRLSGALARINGKMLALQSGIAKFAAALLPSQRHRFQSKRRRSGDLVAVAPVDRRASQDRRGREAKELPHQTRNARVQEVPQPGIRLHLRRVSKGQSPGAFDLRRVAMNAAANFAMRDCSASILPLMRANAPLRRLTKPSRAARPAFGGKITRLARGTRAVVLCAPSAFGCESERPPCEQRPGCVRDDPWE